MKQKKENSVALLLHWAGEQKFWLFLAILLSMCSGLCIIVPYIGIYRLMDATFNNACTKELVVQTVAMISAAVTLRFVLRNWDFREIVQSLAILLVYKHELKARASAHRLVTVTHG